MIRGWAWRIGWLGCSSDPHPAEVSIWLGQQTTEGALEGAFPLRRAGARLAVVHHDVVNSYSAFSSAHHGFYNELQNLNQLKYLFENTSFSLYDIVLNKNIWSSQEFYIVELVGWISEEKNKNWTIETKPAKTWCTYYIKTFHEKKQCPVNLDNFCARKEKISKHTRNKITCIGFVLLKVRSVNLHLFPWVPVLIHTVFSSSPEYFVINFNEPDWRHIQELRIWLESKPA